MVHTLKNRITVSLIWLVAALFTSTQLYLKTLDANGTESWWKLFAIQLLIWSIWGALSPLIFWLGKKFRIDKQTYYKGLAIHLILAVCIVLLYLALYSLVWNYAGIGFMNKNSFLLYFKVFFLNLFHWHFFIYMAIIGAAHAFAYQKELKVRENAAIALEKELVLSELNTLKAQLSPHFLFNTINNVVSTIEQGKNKVAAGMLVRLGDFLRISLEESKHRLIPLKKEFDYLQKYLEIEQFRNKTLDVRVHLDASLEDIQVPSFMLQPIVENAIKHGISKVEAAKNLEIGAERNGVNLKIWVYNDGPALKKTNGISKGIGLANTRKRLMKLYGKKAMLELFSVNSGVLVELRIPIMKTNEI